MVTIRRKRYRKRHDATVRVPRPAPPPAPLTLVSAEYEEAVWVRLTFDRAIDLAGLVGSQIVIDDVAAGFMYAATGAVTPVGATGVQVAVVEVGPSASTPTTLTAGPGNGIVAADDGGAWAGVTGLELPFP